MVTGCLVKIVPKEEAETDDVKGRTDLSNYKSDDPFEHPDRERYSFLDLPPTLEPRGHGPTKKPTTTFNKTQRGPPDAPHTVVSLRNIEAFRRDTRPPNLSFALSNVILYQRMDFEMVFGDVKYVAIEAVHFEIFTPGRADLRFLLVNKGEMLPNTKIGDYVIVSKGEKLPGDHRETVRVKDKWCYPIEWRAVELSTFYQEPKVSRTGYGIVSKVVGSKATILSQLHDEPVEVPVTFPVKGGDMVFVGNMHTFTAQLQTAVDVDWNLYHGDNRARRETTFTQRFGRIAPSSLDTPMWVAVLGLDKDEPLLRQLEDRIGTFKGFKATDEQLESLHHTIRIGSRFNMECVREAQANDEDGVGREQTDIVWMTIQDLGVKGMNECKDSLSSAFGFHKGNVLRGSALLPAYGMLLNQGQTDGVYSYVHRNTAKIFCIHSPPGSGKTRTVACMAAYSFHHHDPDSVQLLCSTTNDATDNIGGVLKEFGFPLHTVCNLKSTAALDINAPKPYDLFDSMEADRLKLLRAAALTDVRRCLNEYVQLPRMGSGFSDSREDEMREERTPRPEIDKQISVAKSHWEGNMMPKILLSTIDTILLKRYSNGNVNATLKIVKSIIIDEASVLSEGALYALIRRFPKARIVLVGDPMQLPPYLYKSGPRVSAYDLAMRSALDVAIVTGVPSIKLTEVYRTTQALAEPYNRLSYDMRLVSNKVQTDFPLEVLGILSRQHTQLLLVDVDGEEKRNERKNKSLSNVEEMEAAIKILKRVPPGYYRDVLVLCLYKEQKWRLEEALQYDHNIVGIRVKTVNSSQGKEAPLVLLLTTKTSGPSEFFTNKRRATVALSRHKDALIVFGKVSFLRGADSWKVALKADFTEMPASNF